MATTTPRNVGLTRLRLARWLEQKLSAIYDTPITVHGEDLHSQVPWYARPQMDCCSWYADIKARVPIRGPDGGMAWLTIHVASWMTMRHVLRERGTIELLRDGSMPHHYEV